MNIVSNFNPYHDEYGRFCSAIMAKMPKLADYKNPTKDYELSPIPTEFLNKLGKIQKPLVLKKNIIEKNKEHHPEVSLFEYNNILTKGIYEADLIFKNKENNEYYNFVHYDSNKNEHVLIELSEEKNNYEIVGFYYLKNKSLKEKLKKATKRVDNEVGQFLITERDNSQGAAVLSALDINPIHIINEVLDDFNPNIYESLYIPTWKREEMAEEYFRR